jgi:hypothetical protein
MQPKPSLWPLAQLQEQRAACVIKGNISSSGERIYYLPGQRYYDKTQSTEGKGNAGSAPNKKPLVLVGEMRRSKRRPSASGSASFQSTA